jgi:uncharacterized iron-regulated membrane protein
MKKRIKFIFKIHSWLGLCTGLLLLVISLSGSVLVFYEEIDLSLNPELIKVKVLSEKISLNKVYATVKEHYPEAENIRFRHLPIEQGHSIEMSIVKGGKYFLVYVNPYSGHFTGERERFTFLMDWLLRLHYTLFAEEKGEIIVAILALLLAVSVSSGVVVYRKYIVKVLLLKVTFKIKNWRQGASEIHRIIGVWSLVFNLMIAITGFYMLYPVLLPSSDGAKQEIIEQRPIDLKIDLEELVSKASKELKEFVPYSISIPSDNIDPVTITGGVKDPNLLSSAYSSFVSFNQATGEVVTVYDIRKQAFTHQLDTSVYPLHFGNYGGIFIKILYSVLGLTPSILSITGFLLWWRQNRNKQNKHKNSREPISKKVLNSRRPLIEN